jgi:hypothetical protein
VAPQEVGIRRIAVQSQPGQIVCKTLSRKKTNHKKGLEEWLKGEGPEFNPQYHNKNKNKKTSLFRSEQIKFITLS